MAAQHLARLVVAAPLPAVAVPVGPAVPVPAAAGSAAVDLAPGVVPVAEASAAARPAAPRRPCAVVRVVAGARRSVGLAVGVGTSKSSSRPS